MCVCDVQNKANPGVYKDTKDVEYHVFFSHRTWWVVCIYVNLEEHYFQQEGVVRIEP
jgi:hypothetical protein